MAAKAYDFRYNIAYEEENQMVPVYGKEGHIAFTARSAGPLAFSLMAKKSVSQTSKYSLENINAKKLRMRLNEIIDRTIMAWQTIGPDHLKPT